MDGLNRDRPNSCPSREALAAVLQLDSNDQVAVQIRAHLHECVHCQTCLDELTEAPELAALRNRIHFESPLSHATERKILADIAARISANLAGDDNSRAVLNRSNVETDVHSNTEVGERWQRTTTPQADGPLPAKIGRYSILGELGRGGAGVVYLAFDHEINRKLALKRVHGCHAGQKERLLQEAQAVARLQTDEVVRIYSIEQDADQIPFITMEYVDGITLSKEIKEQQLLPTQKAVEICIRIANGIQAAHELGILHRDVKPGNILLTRDGAAKLADFGIAHLGETSADLTQTGMLVGTPAYMSPEQAAGNQLDPRSDVYSLGCVLYETLTGSMPFHGTTHQLLNQIIEDEPIAVQRLNENVPGGSGVRLSKGHGQAADSSLPDGQPVWR